MVQPSRSMGFDWLDEDKDTVVSPSTAKSRAAAGQRSMTWPAANNANATGLTTHPQNGPRLDWLATKTEFGRVGRIAVMTSPLPPNSEIWGLSRRSLISS